MNTLLSGATFGAALALSGVYQPHVIISQLTLQDWHMIEAFLTATASSTLLVFATSGFDRLNLKPRNASNLGLLGRYDGNIIGGMLLGTGMALSGACPGTILVQVAVGIPSGFFALGGAALGGIFWTGFLKPSVIACNGAPQAVETLSVHEALRVSRGAVVLSFEVVCTAIVCAVVFLTGGGAERVVHPVVGGFIIGGAQLVSLILRRSLVGVSTCYEEIGDWFWWSIAGDEIGSPRKAALQFATGLVGGAWALSRVFPGLVDSTSVSVPPLCALCGGFLVALGARIAGGCTSGHGISGTSVLSVSSFITVASFLGAGLAAAKVLY
ncbi:hypothetical protein CONLIGDRAFT_625696 [Coniochaeta ligniaria NRRL 30616]|uniref:Uncharacterized protein n=1 Tax=Coniochaeta ligniaria NRRL 30616 TaxID=1408157 RepID=A0A1J7I5D2_9PEZI|nr:hypothetical protein CONLIGDRAFT_625696 [Coniochaeta ligniaria NRRL 30616]